MNLLPALLRGRACATVAFVLGLASSSFAADSSALVYGIQDPGNAVISFRSAIPGRLLSRNVIVGLQPGERVVGLDVRPSTGELYALGSTSRVYLLDPSTGLATPVGGSAFAPGIGGLAFGFDFNPVPDRIRLTSDVEQNQRLHPDTGVTAAQDTLLAYDAADVNAGKDPGIAGSAYTNSFAGTSTTTLYDIDANLDVLVRQGSVNASPLSPDGGKLFTIGALGVDTTNLVGFDISPFGGALAALNPVGMKVSRLFNVNLETGAAALIGTIGGGRPLVGLAIAPPSAPRMVALTTAGRLVSFAPGRPGTLLSDVAISGLAPNEALVGIDVRPATGELVGVGDSSRVYVLDPLTGRATAVGPVFTPALAGVDFAVDFNPIPDRIRLVGDAEQNLRLNPNTGLVAAQDSMLAFDAADVNVGANPNVVAAAYTNPNAGATITTLYAIDSSLDVLVTQGSTNSAPVSPNSGLLFTVGALGQDTTGLTGMDVSQFGGAYASLTATGATQSPVPVEPRDRRDGARRHHRRVDAREGRRVPAGGGAAARRHHGVEQGRDVRSGQARSGKRLDPRPQRTRCGRNDRRDRRASGNGHALRRDQRESRRRDRAGIAESQPDHRDDVLSGPRGYAVRSRLQSDPGSDPLGVGLPAGSAPRTDDRKCRGRRRTADLRCGRSERGRDSGGVGGGVHEQLRGNDEDDAVRDRRGHGCVVHAGFAEQRAGVAEQRHAVHDRGARSVGDRRDRVRHHAVLDGVRGARASGTKRITARDDQPRDGSRDGARHDRRRRANRRVRRARTVM
jgi:hypothetical protein